MQPTDLNVAKKYTLQCGLNREEIVARAAMLADHHILALKNAVDESVFTDLATFPVELIPHTVNGYQRFLTDMGGSAEKRPVIASFILLYKAALRFEMGNEVMGALEKEFIALNTQQISDKQSREGINSLWAIAYPGAIDIAPPNDYDMLCSYLFVSHLKWLAVRVSSEIERSTPKK